MVFKPAGTEGVINVGRINQIMQSPNYADTSILLFDRTRNVRKQTRSVLNGFGFRKFLDFDNLEDVGHALSSQRVDIAVLNLDTLDCGILGMVKDIRGRKVGLDPFMPILLTSWLAKLESVQSFLDSGADDVLLYPFSTAQLAQRIDLLAQERKPFVVTEDYFGPDRRSSALIKKDPTSIKVPNAFRAQAFGLREEAPNTQSVDETLVKLRRMNLRNSSRRIWYLANCLKETFTDKKQPKLYQQELITLRNSLAIYRKTLIAEDEEIVRSLFETLSNLLDGMFGLAPSKRDLRLLEKSALALRLASRLDHEGGEADDAIMEEVANFGRVRKKLDRLVLK